MTSVTKEEIQQLGLSSIKKYFLVNPAEIKNKEVLSHLLQKAKLGMSFEREMNINKRSGEMMTFRILKLTTSDKKELRDYIKNKMPNYAP